MAKLEVNLIFEDDKLDSNLLRVWVPAPATAKELIEAVEGVVRVYHSKEHGYLNVWTNPCYAKTELKAEIRAALPE